MATDPHQQNYTDDQLVTIEVAAEICGVSVHTMRDWKAKGQGPPYIQRKPGEALRYRVGDLRRWIADSTVHPDGM